MENKIKKLRLERKLTQEQLAQILGVTRQTINAVEQNKYDPTLKFALKASEFFKITVNELFSE